MLAKEQPQPYFPGQDSTSLSRAPFSTPFYRIRNSNYSPIMSDATKEANQRLASIQEQQQPAQSATAQQSDNVNHALAGAGGGLVSMALTYVQAQKTHRRRCQHTDWSCNSYPLITLSTRAQVESKKGNTTLLDATKQILDREGVSGLFAGIDSALFGISITNFVYYYCKPSRPSHKITSLTIRRV